ncbi:serine/threonine-protein kinase [Nonomuraea jabiensis]|uniref:serine/threonine-protein kinase n=1 Tax=Nonomuraea jabiensis TaxID=882448 RepID=UPI003D755092
MQPLTTSDPREVGPYRLIAELGRGGMGRVFLGSGPDGRLAAIKRVRAEFAEDEEFRARFSREVEASRKVSGAYTAAVIDADVTASTPWLASVFVPGPALGEAVDAVGALPERSVLRLAAGLATALMAIHRENLVHRDLKPSNVLLADDGPRVIDFGIARAADSDGRSQVTGTGWLIGSPGFMSPEQAEGRPATPASDVFSLGAVLAVACTGRDPFTGPAAPQILYNVVHTEPDLSMIPEGLRRIVEECLAKDPDLRPTPGRLLDSIGRIAPSAQPWPAEVHELIARQRAELARLLDQTAPLSKPRNGHHVLRETREYTAKKEEKPFEVSWTGKEPITGYARRHPLHAGFYGTLALVMFVLSVLADVPGDPIMTGLFETPNEVRWGMLAVSPLLYLAGSAQAAAAARRVQRRMAAWSLRVGPQGIAPGSGPVIPWTAIEDVRLSPISANPLYRGNAGWPYVFDGLHVKLGTTSPTPGTPAGWPVPGGGPSDRFDGWIPICVLGPLTARRRSELDAALARHVSAGSR